MDQSSNSQRKRHFALLELSQDFAHYRGVKFDEPQYSIEYKFFNYLVENKQLIDIDLIGFQKTIGDSVKQLSRKSGFSKIKELISFLLNDINVLKKVFNTLCAIQRNRIKLTEAVLVKDGLDYTCWVDPKVD